MQYSVSELLFYFFIYSFLGWCLEVLYRSLRTGRFENRGLLAGPVCPPYGVGMCVILIALRDMGGLLHIQIVACVIWANVVVFFSNGLVAILSGNRMAERRKKQYALGSGAGLFLTGLWGGIAVLTLYFVHPFVYMLYHMLPRLVIYVLVTAGWVILLTDVIAMCTILRITRKEHRAAVDASQVLHEATQTLGHRIFVILRSHIYKAYPELTEQVPDGTNGFGNLDGKVFAKGICLTKLIWIFVIAALLGDGIETVYVWGVSGVLMSRSSLLYGTFSVVWGIGAVLLTVMLTPLAAKNDRYVFLGGFFLGGFYEYMCSVFTELVFGTVFWDYSEMPLNIGGRTNVLFMFFWGLLSVVWIKIVYPKLSDLIEKIPPMAGLILTWAAVLLLTVDMLLTGAAMLRYTERLDGSKADNAIEKFLDTQYPDTLIEWTWPNMRFQDEI
ncbi:MAG: putative ABC transporter permease [Lachnospiraceae bacterium]|nr:putative ABC transporter permease [Lachnospiraceae bacterium]